ncbi:MAG: hypothetical protein AAGJ73_10885 [Pseudomonadota bacterium]
MRNPLKHAALTLLAALIGGPAPALAQAPVLGGGGDQSVGDVEYCQDGECVVIGKKRKKALASEPETHVFVPGKIPRRPNSNRKAKKYYFDNLQEAIDRVAHNGTVYIHPGVHSIDTITIDGPPRTIHLRAEERDVGRAYLQTTSQKCFTINPDFADDPARNNPMVSFLDISIIANANPPETSSFGFSADGTTPACIDSSRVELHLNRVEINTNGDSVALRVRNKKAKIAQSRFMSSRLQIDPPENVSAKDITLKPPAPASAPSVGIDVANLAELELIAGGRNGSVIAGFHTGVDARGQVKLNETTFKNNRVGVRLRQIDDMMMSMVEDGDTAQPAPEPAPASSATENADTAEDDPAVIMIRDSEFLLAESDAAAGVTSIGVAVDEDYNRALVLNNVEFIDFFNVSEGGDGADVSINDSFGGDRAPEEQLIKPRGRARTGYASANGGVGLLGTSFQTPPIITGGAFRYLAIGADLSSTADFVETEFQQNNIAMRLDYKGGGFFGAGDVSFALDGLKFDGNKVSLDLDFDNAGELIFSNVVLAPSPLEKIRRRKGETFIPGRNKINAPVIRNRRARYPLTCEGDPKSALYAALNKLYVCRIGK